MTYDSLDIIPYKLFVKIAETGDVKLLSSDEIDINILTSIWNKIYEKHLSKNQTSESKKIFKLSKEIDIFITLHKVVLMACECLKFDFEQELFDLIIEKGYKLSIKNTEEYHSDIEKIEREANAYIIKAEYYQNMLPEPKEDEKSEYSIDDVMASYCSILGYSIGKFNEVTYTEYYSHQKSVNEKIKSINTQNAKSNGK